MASLNDYLFVSGLLFAIGLGGVMIRRNIIVIFMSLELMLAAANITSGCLFETSHFGKWPS